MSIHLIATRGFRSGPKLKTTGAKAFTAALLETYVLCFIEDKMVLKFTLKTRSLC
jgi:hypothetical protein